MGRRRSPRPMNSFLASECQSGLRLSVLSLVIASFPATGRDQPSHDATEDSASLTSSTIRALSRARPAISDMNARANRANEALNLAHVQPFGLGLGKGCHVVAEGPTSECCLRLGKVSHQRSLDALKTSLICPQIHARLFPEQFWLVLRVGKSISRHLVCSFCHSLSCLGRQLKDYPPFFSFRRYLT